MDLRDTEDGIVDAVRRLALENAARITLLHVIEEIADLEDGEMKSFYKRLERRAFERLGSVSSGLEQTGVECEMAVRVGRRSEQIVLYATDNEVDLIAMRSRTLRESPAPTWPTISIQVAMISPVPVLLLR